MKFSKPIKAAPTATQAAIELIAFLIIHIEQDQLLRATFRGDGLAKLHSMVNHLKKGA